MNKVILHVLNGLWAEIDEFGIHGMEHEWMVGYKCWHGISMHDKFMLGWWDMILVWFRM